MKAIILLSLLSFNLFALSSYDYAHIYADGLLQVFDKELATNNISLENSKTYKKLLASREFIESLGKNPNIENNKSVIEVLSSNKYLNVVNKIDAIAGNKVIYPSASRNGNVTGNSFPKKTWSLTFDDGPRGERTKMIVDKLYKRGIEATFFMLTAEVKKYLDVARYVVDSNMEVALHSYTHKSLAKPSQARLNYEITQAKRDMENLLNLKLTNFRLPYGAGMHNPDTRKMIVQNNLVHIFWNVDTLDWKDKNPQSVFRRTKLQMSQSPNNSGIILFHDIQKPTVVTSELVMDYLLNNDYNICTIKDVIKSINGNKVNCIK